MVNVYRSPPIATGAYVKLYYTIHARVTYTYTYTWCHHVINEHHVAWRGIIYIPSSWSGTSLPWSRRIRDGWNADYSGKGFQDYGIPTNNLVFRAHP